MPATPISSAELSGNASDISLPFAVADKHLRIYAGQPDPADPAHFTIRYALDGLQGTMEGRVEGSAGIRITVKDGPAIQIP